MPLLNWSEQYSVQVPEMDAQHRILFDCINELHDAMSARQGQAVLGGILDKLIDYTRTHFVDEEALFTSHNYPERESHIREHEAFVEQVAKVRRDYEAKTLMLSLQTLNFLQDWLKNHIQKVDRHYGEWLNKAGKV